MTNKTFALGVGGQIWVATRTDGNPYSDTIRKATPEEEAEAASMIRGPRKVWGGPMVPGPGGVILLRKPDPSGHD
jgi:hypothetical protein